jgi:zinc-ribbon domain
VATGSCKQCGSEIERDFRFCPWCGRAQRLKLTEFFAGHPSIEGEAHRALRVSRYLGESETDRHVRFSVWSELAPGKTRVEAAVSLEAEEAERVARFLETSERTLEAETL